jgi:metacaspase-1
MCFKRIFGNSNPVVPVIGSRTCYSFSINNYPGSANDLNGCINDTRNVERFLNTNYPDFEIVKFIDSEVTRTNFRNQIKNKIVSLVSGDIFIPHYSGHGTFGVSPGNTEADGYSEALYLHDGPFWDYEFLDILKLIPEGAKVIIPLDSCFSKGMATRKINGHYHKSKFMPIQDLKPGVKIKKSILKSDDMRWVLFSGCGETQTSADTFIDGAYCGAFTYYWLKAWNRNYNYKNWIDRTDYLIGQSGEYDQVPELDGDPNLIQQIVLT